jgi:hypothetical protein
MALRPVSEKLPGLFGPKLRSDLDSDFRKPLKPMNCIDRRRFLLSFAGLFGIGALSPELRGTGDDENELSVDFSTPGYLIPENFLGLSFETVGLLLDEILLPENRSFISLVRRLGTKGVIRIGGNSSDRPSLRMGLTIDRTHIEHLAAFLSATGWQLIYGLDLGSGKAEPKFSLSSSAMSPTAFA